jgi:hypothetical protein
MPSTFLTQQEVEFLTGYKRKADQRRWLTDHGWVFSESANGRPVIGRAYAETRLGSQLAAPRAVTLNLAAIRKAA